MAPSTPKLQLQPEISKPVLQFRQLDVRFATPDGEVHAVKGIDLDVLPRETVAIVGESGSGKSQTVMAAVGLLASNGRVSGSVLYRGQELIGLPQRKLNDIRGAKITMIFQEPMTSWGVLISQGAKNISTAPWLLVFPSIFLTSTLFALNFLGDGLRDALDPKDR